jgi:hypothetical protein
LIFRLGIRFEVNRRPPDIEISFFQRGDDGFQSGLFIVKDDNQKIRAPGLMFLDAFDFFKDTTYPAVRASGKATRHG